MLWKGCRHARKKRQSYRTVVVEKHDAPACRNAGMDDDAENTKHTETD